jgi:hypothetical protein
MVPGSEYSILHCRVCKGAGCLLQAGGAMALVDMLRHALFPRLRSVPVKRCDTCDGTGVSGYERQAGSPRRNRG